jgi:hypothetical protein
MQYADHEDGAWFLLESDGALYLDARYSYSAVIDDSALVRLDEREVERYRSGGRGYLSDLARRIHHSAPYSETSPYYERDLYRGSDGPRYRAQVMAATTAHAAGRRDSECE